MWCHHVYRSGMNDLPVFWPQGFAVPAHIVFAQILYLCKTPEWLRGLGLFENITRAFIAICMSGKRVHFQF